MWEYTGVRKNKVKTKKSFTVLFIKFQEIRASNRKWALGPKPSNSGVEPSNVLSNVSLNVCCGFSVLQICSFVFCLCNMQFGCEI